MSAYVFNLTPDLERIIAHTKERPATSRVAYEGNKIGEDSLWLVKDSGAYLMTATTERLTKPKSPRAVVVYADGMTPDDGHIGGDDFAVNVPLEWFTDAIKQKHTVFVITITSNRIRFQSK